MPSYQMSTVRTRCSTNHILPTGTSTFSAKSKFPKSKFWALDIYFKSLWEPQHQILALLLEKCYVSKNNVITIHFHCPWYPVTLPKIYVFQEILRTVKPSSLLTLLLRQTTGHIDMPRVQQQQMQPQSNQRTLTGIVLQRTLLTLVTVALYSSGATCRWI